MLVASLLFTILGLLVWIGALLGQCDLMQRRHESQQAYAETLEDKLVALESQLYRQTLQQYRNAAAAQTNQFPAMEVVAETEMTI